MEVPSNQVEQPASEIPSNRQEELELPSNELEESAGQIKPLKNPDDQIHLLEGPNDQLEASAIDVNSDQPETIKTFAFFDLETTGLPQLEFFKTKIIELSIVACSVEHLADSEFPRVQHKLTLCFNPYKRISLTASEITGLNNYLLEHENKLDQNSMKLIEAFLLQLQQPVCLIAHNGENFDFPLFKKEQEKLFASLPPGLKCCDSLPVFKAIDELNERKMKLLNESYSLQEWSDVKESELLIDGDDEKFTDIPENEVNETNGVNRINDTVPESKAEVGCIEKLEALSEKQQPGEIKSLQVLNETTPDKPSLPVNKHPSQIASLAGEIRKRPINSRRQLFPPTSQAQDKSFKRFTLREIHKRFFNEYPAASHDSESDVVSLMKCASACKLDFIRIVNDTCKNFSDIKRL